LIVGIAAFRRVSSATAPPSSGTLKSTLIRTRFPATSTFSMLFFMIPSVGRIKKSEP
jgi:hypothetical protein